MKKHVIASCALVAVIGLGAQPPDVLDLLLR